MLWQRYFNIWTPFTVICKEWQECKSGVRGLWVRGTCVSWVKGPKKGQHCYHFFLIILPEKDKYSKVKIKCKKKTFCLECIFLVLLNNIYKLPKLQGNKHTTTKHTHITIGDAHQASTHLNTCICLAFSIRRSLSSLFKISLSENFSKCK